MKNRKTTKSIPHSTTRKSFVAQYVPVPQAIDPYAQDYARWIMSGKPDNRGRKAKTKPPLWWLKPQK